MDVFPDLTDLTDQELSLLLQLEQDEEDVSRRQRALHGRIDLLRAEQTTRLRDKLRPARPSSPTTRRSPRRRGAWTPARRCRSSATRSRRCRISSSSRRQATVIHEPELVEDETSLHRRMLHGKIDILRAERGTLSVAEGEEASHVQVDAYATSSRRTSSEAAPDSVRPRLLPGVWLPEP